MEDEVLQNSSISLILFVKTTLVTEDEQTESFLIGQLQIQILEYWTDWHGTWHIDNGQAEYTNTHMCEFL